MPSPQRQSSDSQTNAPNQKIKSQQSCDICRTRKIKCVAEDQGEGSSGSRAKRVCKHCIGAELQCTYDYVPKKRGPPSSYVKRLREARAEHTELGGDMRNEGNTATKKRTREDGKSHDVSNEKRRRLDSLLHRDALERAQVDKADGDDNSNMECSRNPQSIRICTDLPKANGIPLQDESHRDLDSHLSPWKEDLAKTESSYDKQYQRLEGDDQYLPAAFSMSPALRDRWNLDYVDSPVRNTAALLDVMSQVNHSNTGPPRQFATSAHGAYPEPDRARNEFSLPVYKLRSKTLGEVSKRRASVVLPTYTSSPENLLAPSWPNLSSLLNPDPTNHPAISPTFVQPISPLDAVLPRSLLHLVIGLFKDFVYPLTPCVHMPTLLQDLAQRREMQPGQGEWTAMVLATVMATVVQVPRAFIPLSRSEVSILAERCYAETRKWSQLGYGSNITVNAVIVNYFRTIYNFVRDRSVESCHASLCEAQALATVLRLHEEESYTCLNPIEREMRRRTFFLLFCSDKSEAVLLGRPIKMREEDCYNLRLPEELDDEYITEAKYLHQPPGVTSLTTGLNASIRIHTLMGRTLAKWRDDKRIQMTESQIERRMDEVERLLQEVMGVMKGCPVDLELSGGSDFTIGQNFSTDAEQVLHALFYDSKASREYARDAYLVQTGNIYVVQQLARFVLLQYQSELLAMKKAFLRQPSGLPGASRYRWTRAGGMAIGGLGSGSLESGYTVTTSQPSASRVMAATRESLFNDLLAVLHNVPIQCIAVNGPSLVNAVRYMAAALLDKVIGNPTIGDESTVNSPTEEKEGVLRARDCLNEFLNVLNEIEKHYSWGDITGSEATQDA